MNLPPLCSPKDVGSRILLQQRTEAAKAAAESVAMDMEDSDNEAEEDEEGGGGGDAGAPAAEGDERELQEEARMQQQQKQHTGSTVTQPAPAAPIAGNVVIRDYDPKKCEHHQFSCPPRLCARPNSKKVKNSGISPNEKDYIIWFPLVNPRRMRV